MIDFIYSNSAQAFVLLLLSPPAKAGGNLSESFSKHKLISGQFFWFGNIVRGLFRLRKKGLNSENNKKPVVYWDLSNAVEIS